MYERVIIGRSTIRIVTMGFNWSLIFWYPSIICIIASPSGESSMRCEQTDARLIHQQQSAIRAYTINYRFTGGTPDLILWVLGSLRTHRLIHPNSMPFLALFKEFEDAPQTAITSRP